MSLSSSENILVFQEFWHSNNLAFIRFVFDITVVNLTSNTPVLVIHISLSLFLWLEIFILVQLP